MKPIMRAMLALLHVAALAACATSAGDPSPDSDAPDAGTSAVRFQDASSLEAALEVWRSPEDINAWIGARFQYDVDRSMRLSETQRTQGARLPIHAPTDFFHHPEGVCVDLARFGVEALRRLDPGLKPRYVMIEFDPATIRGNVLRRHWVTAFERDGQLYFFADSKRPGHIAGPYASIREYLAEYAAYRGREIVSARERDSYQRQGRKPATRQARADR